MQQVLQSADSACWLGLFAIIAGMEAGLGREDAIVDGLMMREESFTEGNEKWKVRLVYHDYDGWQPMTNPCRPASQPCRKLGSGPIEHDWLIISCRGVCSLWSLARDFQFEVAAHLTFIIAGGRSESPVACCECQTLTPIPPPPPKKKTSPSWVK